VAPHLLLESAQRAFGPDAIFTADSGNGTFLAVECLRLDRPHSLLAPIDYSCMGYAVPGALGAALANPERPVVALAGDGALLMTGLELLTGAHLGIPVVVIVLRDRSLAQIAQFQETAFARTTASELPDYDLAALCGGVGVQHLPLAENDAVQDVLTRARRIVSEGRPVVVECAIDYSKKTYFTRGVVRTTFGRMPWPDRLRFVARAVGRRLPGVGN
jgi:acetolactate synthase-1/2/3 large subunit